ncbi:hypothetical protein [Algivirga pacifica]|uniref:Oxygen tolerance n=1 Tax=Algivirga pacifica TaxID=1162670 RepID=A0ABP9DDH9_9BACT
MINNKLLGLFLICLLTWTNLKAQEQSLPVGSFIGDSIQMGQEVSYVLSFEHPSSMEVFFPDSTYDYSPYEYVSHQAFPTRSEGGISKDSVVYTLTTFEMDSVLELALPAIVVNKKGVDEMVYPEKDGLFYQAVLTDTTTVSPENIRSNTQQVHVAQSFNYLLWGSILFGVILLLGLLLVFMWPTIQRWNQKRKLRKEYALFREHFKVSGALDHKQLEIQVKNWKVFLGKLMHQPVQSYTTKEMALLIDNEELHTALRSLDRVVYAGKGTEEMEQSLQVLDTYATQTFETKLREVSNE